MEKTQLTTIIVTAIVTAFLKVSVDGLVKVVSTQLVGKLSKETKQIFMIVIFESSIALFNIYYLHKLIQVQEPISRLDIVFLSMWTSVTIFSVYVFGYSFLILLKNIRINIFSNRS
ncbi:MAG: hypothetical protein Q7T53_10055 [Deltaproteobacteria bacterium]|nr:hypothetical protein [Deltaproteobacteria bacterium]